MIETFHMSRFVDIVYKCFGLVAILISYQNSYYIKKVKEYY